MNKKIIFVILLFIGMSFIIYSFANPMPESGEGLSSNNDHVNKGNSQDSDKDQKDTNKKDQNGSSSTKGDKNSSTDDKETDAKDKDSNVSGGSSSGSFTIGNNNSSSTSGNNRNPSYNGGGSYIPSHDDNNSYTPSTPSTPSDGNGSGSSNGGNNSSGGDSSGNNPGNSGDGNTGTTPEPEPKPEVPTYGSLVLTEEAEKDITVVQHENNFTLTGTMKEKDLTPGIKTGSYIRMRLVAPKMYTADQLSKMKVKLLYNGMVYTQEQHQILDGLGLTEKAYFYLTQEFTYGKTISILVDWGDGNSILYNFTFNIVVTPKDE